MKEEKGRTTGTLEIEERRGGKRGNPMMPNL